MSSEEKINPSNEDQAPVTEPNTTSDDGSENEPSQQASAENAPENPSLTELRERLDEAEQKAQDNWDALLRERAEMENVKRRAERDVSNARKFALDRICSDIMPVLDSLEQGLALEANNDETKAVQEGMAMTQKLLIDVLNKHGVEQLDPKGELFNPEHHEAVAMQESEEHEPNTVISVFQKGYVLNGRLVRAARVVVAKGTSATIDTKA